MFSKSIEAYNKAKKIIPGGVNSPVRAFRSVNSTPIFFKSGKGSKVIDVDGNEFLDMLCAYGPIIIGYREEEIDNAVIEQIKNNGVCFSLTHPVHNELSETLKKYIPCCETSVFLKTGSDATSAAIRAARCYTGKDKILRWFDEIGAKYPAEHNVGHVYEADDNLRKFYRKLDPCNIFNPGIGKTSKTINKPDSKIKEINIT